MSEDTVYVNAEEKYQQLFELELDAIFLIRNSDGQIIEVNSSACSMYGYSKEELLSMKNTDLSAEPDQTRNATKKVEKTITAGIPVRYHKRKDGTVIPVEITARFFVFNGENVHIAAIRDITFRLESEKELLDSRRRYEAMFGNMKNGVIVLSEDVQKNIIIYDINSSGAKIIDVKKSDIVGKLLLGVYPNMIETDVYKNIKHVFETGGAITMNEYFFRGQRRDFWFNIYIYKLFSSEVVLIFDDITENMNYKEKIINAQRIESLGMLAGGIAHDFNNLLAGIFGNIDLARLSLEKPEETAAHLTMAMNVLDRARDLTAQLLTFSRGGAPRKATVNLKPVLIESAQFAVSGSRCCINFKAEENIWDCAADPHQIAQIIDNIVINAVHAMPMGGVITAGIENICAGTEKEFEHTDCVRIFISDTGAGIPAEYLGHVFDPFFTTKQAGSGLGLAIAYSVVSKHNGMIRAFSNSGKGTTVEFFIPAMKTEKSEVSENSEEILELIPGTGNILLMDDEIYIQQTAKKILELAGYIVDCVSSGEEAVQKYSDIHSGKYDLVILDLTVPGGISGVETLNRLQKVNPKLKALISSGYSSDDAVENYAEKGFAGFILKPYTVHELTKTVFDVLQ